MPKLDAVQLRIYRREHDLRQGEIDLLDMVDALLAERETLLQREKGYQLEIAAMTVKLGHLVKEWKDQSPLGAIGPYSEALTDCVDELSALLPLDIEGWIREHDRELLERASASICEWCREGNVPTVEKDFLNPGAMWHKVYVNWLLCPASPIRALLPASAGKPEGDAE